MDGGEALIGGLCFGVRLCRVHDALLHELRGVLRPHRRRLLDALVHRRLRVRGLVGFVVTVAAIADQIDHDVAMEFLAIHHREPHRRQARLGVVGIDVNDRHIKAFGQIARVVGGATLARVRGEADLVVENQVQRAARRVSAQPREIKSLGDHALARERRVAVDEHREHGEPGLAHVEHVLLGPDHSLGHWVHRLKMAGIGH